MNCLTPVEWAYGHTWFPLTWESLCENFIPAKTMAEDGEPNLCCHYLHLPGQHCAIAYFQKGPYHSETHRHPPDIPQIPTRHLQRAGDANRQQQTPPDTNRQPQTPKDTDKCCLSTSGGVCWRLLSSVGISCSLEMSGGCLGDVWWVSGGI